MKICENKFPIRHFILAAALTCIAKNFGNEKVVLYRTLFKYIHLTKIKTVHKTDQPITKATILSRIRLLKKSGHDLPERVRGDVRHQDGKTDRLSCAELHKLRTFNIMENVPS